MSPEGIREARATLGALTGLGRPLHAAELGRMVGLAGRDPGLQVLRWESGKAPITGPVATAIESLIVLARLDTGMTQWAAEGAAAMADVTDEVRAIVDRALARARGAVNPT